LLTSWLVVDNLLLFAFNITVPSYNKMSGNAIAIRDIASVGGSKDTKTIIKK
jgi:hypothetical protein